MRGAKDRVSRSSEPVNFIWARLWMKKLSFVATLPRLDSINLVQENTKRRMSPGTQVPSA